MHFKNRLVYTTGRLDWNKTTVNGADQRGDFAIIQVRFDGGFDGRLSGQLRNRRQNEQNLFMYWILVTSFLKVSGEEKKGSSSEPRDSK